jgi:hypothetical protein
MLAIWEKELNEVLADPLFDSLIIGVESLLASFMLENSQIRQISTYKSFLVENFTGDPSSPKLIEFE